MQLKRFKDAKEMIIEIIPADYLNDHFLHQLVECHFGLEELEKAKKVIESAIGMYPEDSYFLAQYSVYFYEKEDYKNAIQYIREALKFEPKNVSYLSHFGSIHLNLGNLSRAEQTLDLAEQIDPVDLRVIAEKARLAFLKNDISEANVYINKGLEIDPNNSHFILLKSNLLTTDKTKMKEAEATAIQALSMDPSNEVARHTLLNVLKNKNRLLRFFVGNAFGHYQMEWTFWRVLIFIVAWKGVLLWGGFAILYMLITWYGGVLFNSITRLHKKYKLLLNQNDINQSNFFIGVHVILLLLLGSRMIVGLEGENLFALISLTLAIMLIGISYFELEEKEGKIAYFCFVGLFGLVIYGFHKEAMILGGCSIFFLLLYGFLFSFRVLFK